MKQLVGMALLAWSGLAFSQTQTALPVMCDNKDKVAAVLQKEFKEQPTIAGVAGENPPVLMTTWVNMENKNWTVTLTTGNLTCVLASGVNFVVRKMSDVSLKPAGMVY